MLALSRRDLKQRHSDLSGVYKHISTLGTWNRDKIGASLFLRLLLHETQCDCLPYKELQRCTDW